MSIDYSIRIPDFVSAYNALKSEIFVGAFAATEQMVKEAAAKTKSGDYNEEFEKADITKVKENNKIVKEESLLGIDQRNYWNELNQTDPKAIEFYKNVVNPTANLGKDFDLTYSKYFYSHDHRMKFLQDYSYNLFGAGQVTNKSDIEILNIAQTKLCDIVLFDRTPYARKVPNTFAFLSRAGLYIRSVIFTTSEEDIKQAKEGAIAVWDPKADEAQCIDYPKKVGQPTQKLLEFFMEVEKKIKAADGK
jgi:hypothetical protein